MTLPPRATMPVNYREGGRPMTLEQDDVATVARLVREVDQLAGSLVGVLSDLGSLRQELEELVGQEATTGD